MKQEDKREFAEAMQMLCAAYLVEPTKPLLAGYWIALEALTLDEVQAAITKALKTGDDFIPTGPELRSMARPKVLPYHQPWKGFAWDKDRKRIDESWEPRRRELAAMKKAGHE